MITNALPPFLWFTVQYRSNSKKSNFNWGTFNVFNVIETLRNYFVCELILQAIISTAAKWHFTLSGQNRPKHDFTAFYHLLAKLAPKSDARGPLQGPCEFEFIPLVNYIKSVQGQGYSWYEYLTLTVTLTITLKGTLTLKNIAFKMNIYVK